MNLVDINTFSTGGLGTPVEIEERCLPHCNAVLSYESVSWNVSFLAMKMFRAIV